MHEEDDLQCPELVLLALDLIINHHERFLETHEEARQEAEEARTGKEDGDKSVDQVEGKPGPSTTGDQSWDQQQQQLKDQSLERGSRGVESIDHNSTVVANQIRKQHTGDQGSEGDVLDFRGVKLLPDTTAGGVEEKSDCTVPDVRTPLKEPGGGGRRKRRRRKRQTVGPSDAESATSTSSVYHTLPSDGSNTTEGQDSDWEPDVSCREEEMKTNEGLSDNEEEDTERAEEPQTEEEKDETNRYSGEESEQEEVATDLKGVCPKESAATEEKTIVDVSLDDDDLRGSIRKDESNLTVTKTSIKESVCDGVKALEGESAGEGKTIGNKETDSSLIKGEHIMEKSDIDQETGEPLCDSKDATEPSTCRKNDVTSPFPDPMCCGSEAGHSATLTQCVHALLLLCRSSPAVCRRLHTLGLLSRLLEGFTDLIAANSPLYQGEYCTIQYVPDILHVQ